MPRVTFEKYCRQREDLKNTWAHRAGNFSKLSAENQWRLHDYFRFSEDLTRDQLYEHWMELRKDPNSSHPQYAGKAYAAMRPYVVNAPIKPVSMSDERPVRPRKKAQKVVRVESLVKPEIDVDKFVKVLMDVAKEMRERRKG